MSLNRIGCSDLLTPVNVGRGRGVLRSPIPFPTGSTCMCVVMSMLVKLQGKFL